MNLRVWANAALAAVLVVCCRPAAALDEAGRCLHDKLHADRAATSRYLACTRFAAGSDVRADCVARAEGKLRRRLAVADARAAAEGFVCPAGAEALGLVGPDAWPLRFLDEVVPGTGACARLVGIASRRYARRWSRCLEDGLLRGHDPDECAARARSRFEVDYARAEACVAVDAASAREALEHEVSESASRLVVRCGDHVIAGREECDDGNSTDGDGCSADCLPERCGVVDGGGVACVACPADSVPTPDYDGCRCAHGFEGEPGACVDIDECVGLDHACSEDRPCVNLPGTYACAIECTPEAFHAALAGCGAPTGAIAFACSDATIAIPAGMVGREVFCDGLTIDGAGRDITFELAPLCWQTVVEPSQCPGGLATDGTCRCPDVDSGDTFLRLRGSGNVVRDLTVRGFFEGIPARGRGNLVENVRFERMCDDAFGTVNEGAGNVFRNLVVRNGCDKCSENHGDFARTDADPRLDTHYNAILDGIRFEGCATPVRVSTSGRFLLRDVVMTGGDAGFPCDGPRFTAASASDRVVVRLERSTIEGCRRGIRFGLGAEGVVLHSRIANGGLRGVRVASNARVSVEGTTIDGNGGGRSTEPGFGGAAVLAEGLLDLGGGALEIDGAIVTSAGGNSICANAGPDGFAREVDNATANTVPARGNWWCSASSPDSRILGPAATEPQLDRAPAGVIPAGD